MCAWGREGQTIEWSLLFGKTAHVYLQCLLVKCDGICLQFCFPPSFWLVCLGENDGGRTVDWYLSPSCLLPLLPCQVYIPEPASGFRFFASARDCMKWEKQVLFFTKLHRFSQGYQALSLSFDRCSYGNEREPMELVSELALVLLRYLLHLSHLTHRTFSINTLHADRLQYVYRDALFFTEGKTVQFLMCRYRMQAVLTLYPSHSDIRTMYYEEFVKAVQDVWWFSRQRAAFCRSICIYLYPHTNMYVFACVKELEKNIRAYLLMLP